MFDKTTKINLMEVCGTHTMSIAKNGIKSILPENIRLLSGPGCPVCVTPPEIIDAVLKLSEEKNILIATYGDMLKVPGSVKGESLLKKKALGANVEIVYSSLDALELAKKNPEKEIVFLGVGFETTSPGTAACIKAAASDKVKNFSVFCMLKTIEPALRALIKSPGFNVQGFLCPGHVAVILGEEGFRFLTDEYRIPSVIAGFESGEILTAVKLLLDQIKDGMPKLENAYKKAVEPEGNILAKQMIKDVFACLEGGSDYSSADNGTETRIDFDSSNTSTGKTGTIIENNYNDLWRGLGYIPESGLYIRTEYKEYDAVKKFDIGFESSVRNTACRCGEVICGKIKPSECPLFETACTPADPEGPCMVSSEGACAAAYIYSDINK